MAGQTYILRQTTVGSDTAIRLGGNRVSGGVAWKEAAWHCGHCEVVCVYECINSYEVFENEN